MAWVVYPRSRVFYEQSATPYVGVVFSVVRIPGSAARLLAFPGMGRHPEDFYTSRGWVPVFSVVAMVSGVPFATGGRWDPPVTDSARTPPTI